MYACHSFFRRGYKVICEQGQNLGGVVAQGEEWREDEAELQRGPKTKLHSHRDLPPGLLEPHVCFSSFWAAIVVMRVTAMFYLKANYSGVKII